LGLDEKFVRKMRSDFLAGDFADDHAIALSAIDIVAAAEQDGIVPRYILRRE
jgi:hypothetical protein